MNEYGVLIRRCLIEIYVSRLCPLSQRQVAKMRLFQNVRTHFETMGIYSVQTNQAQPFNSKISLILLYFLITLISTTACVVFKASAVFEYAIGFYFCNSRLTALAVYLIIWLQMPNIIKFIGNCEQFIEKS